MSAKRLYQNPFILPVVITLTFFCLLLETIKYPGFMANHFYIGVNVYFALSLVLLIFLNTESKKMKFVFKANQVFLIVISIIYLTLNLVEGAHYTNYILNVFRFHLDGMVYLALFSLYIFLIEKFKYLIPNKVKNLGIIYPAIIFAIVFNLISNSSYISNTAFTSNSYILFHLGSSYDQKMSYQWGKFYDFMVFVRNNTPENATIILPPMENPWLMGSGNPHFVRAFIFPRKIVQEAREIPETDIKSFEQNTYILITWGKEVCSPEPGCHGWPRQKILASEIIYKNSNDVGVAEVRKNTIYDPADQKYVYGLIKL